MRYVHARATVLATEGLVAIYADSAYPADAASSMVQELGERIGRDSR